MSVPDVLDAILAFSQSAPERAAAQDLERDLTYGDLEAEVIRLASGLVANGVQPGDRLALHLPNSVDFVVASLASLWIGSIFVPLAVGDPEARRSGIVSDCAPALIVTSDQGADTLGLIAPIAFPVATMSQLRQTGALAPPARFHGHEAYAIYTSGTTGAPKGVLIGNRAFAAAAATGSALLGLHEHTRTLCVSPFHFDGSYGALFLTLFRGGAIVIRPRDSLLFPRTFFNTVAREGITYTSFSPSYLRLLIASKRMPILAATNLEVMALGGEAASADDIRQVWDAAPRLRVFNRYGPTETTIAVTTTELTRELIADGSVPIGKPHSGTTFHLLDEHDQLIHEDRSIGELYIGGEQLMSRYWGAPQLSAEVLRSDVIPGETLYRTGDLAYRDKTGDYVYVDRADRIVKRSGVRISLLEVASAYRQLPGVSAATCVTYDDDHQLGIALFVVSDGKSGEGDLQSAALDLLPATMLANRVFFVSEFPLTGSSKLAEHSLLAQVGLEPRKTRQPPDPVGANPSFGPN